MPTIQLQLSNQRNMSNKIRMRQFSIQLLLLALQNCQTLKYHHHYLTMMSMIRNNLYQFQDKLKYINKMILGKYKKIKKLGKGAFGDVSLYENEANQRYAIKVINKKMLMSESFLMDYFQKEIECMKQMSYTPYVMKFIEKGEDDQSFYIVCQFCNMGDLLNLQAKQPNKVFELKKATYILSEVIKGLEELHGKKYLHRDIKPQNILITKTQEDQILYKLADFGFAKDSDHCTVLGTQSFMAPEIYQQEGYGVEVDIWALGVTFYFMLNMSYPFKLTNAHSQNRMKQSELMMLSKNFSYEKSVAKTLKKLSSNCNEDTQDFFKRIFDPKPENRLTFIEIREHPLFKEYFPTINEKTYEIYGKYNKRSLKNNKKAKNLPEKSDNKQQQFKKQFSTVKYICSKADFIEQIESELVSLTKKHKIFPQGLMASYSYNITKMRQLVLSKLIYKKLTLGYLKQLQPSLQWTKFSETNYFQNLIKQYEDQIESVKKKVKSQCKQCQKYFDEIQKFNQDFIYSCSPKLSQDTFIDKFKTSYLTTTRILYRYSRKQYQTNKHQDIVKIMVLSTLSHVIWQIVNGPNDMVKSALKEYFDHQTQEATLKQFTTWLTIAKSNAIKTVIKSLINTYFHVDQA